MAEFTFVQLLSRPEFAIFDFAPGETHTIASPEALGTARHLLEVLTAHCLDELGFDASDSRTHDSQFDSDLTAWCADHVLPLCGDDPSKTKIVNAAVRTAAVLSDYLYPYHDSTSRTHLARMSVAGIVLDDFAGHEEAPLFGRYVYDILMGSEAATERSGWLGFFTRLVREYIAHFGENDPRAGVLGGEALFNYISSLENEKRFNGSIWDVPPHLRPPSTSKHSFHHCCPAGFPRWLRAQSGASAAYIAGLFHSVPFDYWIPALNPLVRFTDRVNDLMSFSKEILASVNPEGGMDNNYVTLQTLVRRQSGTPSRFGQDGNLYTYRDGLCEIMDELVQVVREADRAFVEYPRHCSEEQRRLWSMDQAARAWTAYKNGHIRMHIDSPRWSTAGLKTAVQDREAWVKLKADIRGDMKQARI